MTCRYCGVEMDPSDLLHFVFCDGQQGKVEAVLDVERAHEVTEAAVAKVTASASSDYLEMLTEDGIRLVALERPRLSSDEIWEKLGVQRMSAGNASALGRAMRMARERGYIVPTSERKDSQRPARHRCPVRVWESRIYQEMRRHVSEAR